MDKEDFENDRKRLPQMLRESVNGKELSEILKIGNKKKGKSYENETFLDDIYFAVNKGERQHLSKIKDVQPPNEFSVLEIDFFKTNKENSDNMILSCKLNGLVDTAFHLQKELNEAKESVQTRFFNAALEFAKMYFGGDE